MVLQGLVCEGRGGKKLTVKADVAPMIRNCVRLKRAATKPEAMRATQTLAGTIAVRLVRYNSISLPMKIGGTYSSLVSCPRLAQSPKEVTRRRVLD